MRLLHLHLTRQVMWVLLVAIGVFASVLLLGNTLKEILALLVNRQVDLGVVGRAIGLLLPFVLVYSLPIGLLVSVLLVFGRLSADQEVVAVRAGGVSLMAWVSPVLLLGIAASVVCGWLNLEFAPRSRVAFKLLTTDQRVLKPEALLTPRRFITEFPNWTIYLGRQTSAGFQDVLFYGFAPENGKLIRRIHAERATVRWNLDARQAEFKLFQAQVYFRVESETGPPVSEAAGVITTMASDPSSPEWGTFFLGEVEQPVDFNPAVTSILKPKISEMTFQQLREELTDARARDIDPSPIVFHLHRQLSFSFACVGFVLVGIPLGIRAHRRETSAGLLIALLLVLGYFGFFFLGQSLETKPAAYPHLIVWLPNLLFQSAGCVGLWRANRGW